jgi:aspartate/methionine/tyrosine aminotransferase
MPDHEPLRPVLVLEAALEAALEAPASDVVDPVSEWQRRRDTLLAELEVFPVLPSHGGWSLLQNCSPLGLTGVEAAERLLPVARSAATPRAGWDSPVTAHYLRFVFANEPCERLQGLGERVCQALG